MDDLPHTPRTIPELQNAVATILEDFELDAQEWAFELTTHISKKRYGVKIELAWWSPSGEYCRCHNRNCLEVQHGKYPFRDIVFRVQSDLTLEYFKIALKDEEKYIRKFSSLAEDSSPLRD
jgi:hypothetical protein